MRICIIGSYAKALVMTADRIPLVGETLVGYDYRGTYGGKGSDMAVQAARLGAKVGYIGVVGDDPFGQEFLALMRSEGVSTGGIRVTKERPTGVGFIIKDRKALNVIVVDKGANGLFSAKDIDGNIGQIEAADVVLAQLEIPVETALYALKRAKSLGKTTILNPAPAVGPQRPGARFRRHHHPERDRGARRGGCGGRRFADDTAGRRRAPAHRLQHGNHDARRGGCRPRHQDGEQPRPRIQGRCGGQ